MQTAKLLVIGLIVVACQLPLSARAQKTALYESINQRDAADWETALKIWRWAEPGYQETKSSQLLAETLTAAGFQVKR